MCVCVEWSDRESHEWESDGYAGNKYYHGELVFIAISCYAIQLQLIRDPSDRLPGPQFSARDGNLLYWNSLRVVNNAHPSDWTKFESKGVTSNRVASFVSYLRMWRSPTRAPQCESDNSKLSPFFFYTG